MDLFSNRILLVTEMDFGEIAVDSIKTSEAEKKYCAKANRQIYDSE
jgi:hypothetical protein